MSWQVSSVAVFLVPVPAAGQAETSQAAERWAAPRTPEGHPDLQGVWANNSATPLERPEQLASKESLTDD